MTHLSSEQIAQWIAGECAGDAGVHLAGCACCRAELSEMEEVLAQFRGSVCSISAPAAALPEHRAPLWPRWVAVGAAAAALLMLAPVYRDRRAREMAAAERQDALLLQQVDAEVSRAVPGSLDPLVKMVSWNHNEVQK